MKTIAILVHFTPDYEKLVRFGVNLALELNMSVLLNYSYNPASVPLVTPGLLSPAFDSAEAERMNAEIRAKIESLAEKMQQINPVSEIHYQLTEGFERNIVNDLSKREDIELIITNNESGDIFSVSSATSEIIADSDCPVLIVPEGTDYKPINTIIYATDYKEEDIATLRKLVKLFGNAEPQITALHITDNVDFEERIMKEGFSRVIEQTGYEKMDIKILGNKTNADVPEIIDGYASLIDADLIVVLKKNINFFEMIFNRGTTKKLINQTNIPIIVFHGNNNE